MGFGFAGGGGIPGAHAHILFCERKCALLGVRTAFVEDAPAKQRKLLSADAVTPDQIQVSPDAIKSAHIADKPLERVDPEPTLLSKSCKNKLHVL